MGVGDVALTAAGWLAALACSLPVCSAARVVRVCTSAVITCYHAAGPCRLIWSVDCSDREEQDHWSLQFCTRSQGGQYICTVPEKDIVVGPTWRCAAAGLWPTYPPMGAGWAPPRRVRNSWTTTSKRPQIDANASFIIPSRRHTVQPQFNVPTVYGKSGLYAGSLPCPTSQQIKRCVWLRCHERRVALGAHAVRKQRGALQQVVLLLSVL